MTKLEKQIRDCISYTGQAPDDIDEDVKHIAALVIDHIERAYIEGYYALATDLENPVPDDQTTAEALAEQWLKENGIK